MQILSQAHRIVMDMTTINELFTAFGITVDEVFSGDHADCPVCRNEADERPLAA